MAIPSTAKPAGLNVHELSNGRWEATCGKCLTRSIQVPSADATSAWDELQKLGWIHFVSEYGGVGYAVCADCLKVGPTTPKRRTRKRK